MAEVRIGEEAEEDYTHARAWYQARSARVAEGFETAFAEVLERIGQSPEHFPACDEEGYSFALLDRYPYGLIYRTVGEVVQVVAVAHSRRRPGYWSGRESHYSSTRSTPGTSSTKSAPYASDGV